MRSPASLQTHDSHCRTGVEACPGEAEVCQSVDMIRVAKDKPAPDMAKPLIQRGPINMSRGDGS